MINYTSSVADIKTVVDAIRATDLPVITTHLTDIKGATWNAVAHTLVAIKDKINLIYTPVTNIETVVDAVQVTSDKLDPRLPDKGTLYTVGALSSYWITASDDLLHSNDTEGNNDAVAWTKVKEIIVPFDGTYRVKFDIKSDSPPHNASGRIYKGGVAHGAIQANGTSSYVTYSEDLVFAKDDLLQLYVNMPDVGEFVWYQNLRLYGVVDFGFKNEME